MVRYDDDERTLACSARDLVEAGAARGDLRVSVAQSKTARLELGRRAHVAWQEERGATDEAFRAEVRLQRKVIIDGWTCTVHGRVDGLSEEDGRTLVEEVKTTVLDAPRLYGTTLADWPDWAGQVEIYLWMLVGSGHVAPTGRLVIVSLLDGSQHVLGLSDDDSTIDARIVGRLTELVEAREERIAWLASRRASTVPRPHDEWRPGQREIAEVVEWGLDAGNQVLVEAPTGLGKTAAVLYGALRHCLAHDKQLFFATSRTTQQPGVLLALERFASEGLTLRAVQLGAKERVCLNDVVACSPERCAHAAGYYDKLRDAGLLSTLRGTRGTESIVEAARQAELCPYELALDLSERVDVVVGDYNYALDPAVHVRRHFGDAAGRWVLVVDEAHQLVERARGWRSPRLELAAAEEAVRVLGEAGPNFDGVVALANDIAAAVRGILSGVEAEETVTLPPDWLAAIAARIDTIALDYALLSLESPIVEAGESDPWLECARQVLRFHAVLEEGLGEHTVVVADGRPGRERVGLLCLDPSGWLGPHLARLGGFVGCSATLSPVAFYRDLLGLDPERLDHVTAPPPFPADNCQVFVAPRVSTAWRDRPQHAPATATLLQACFEQVPGNTAVYFPSFDMLDDIAERWTTEREVLRQTRTMDQRTRAEWLARLARGGPPVVLAAVLGGIFAEGIDLPAGALRSVLIAGPALPPIGLERTLLKEHYEQCYGEGFRYASLVPGLTRVVQAAGRLIRRPEDTGVIVLVGRRFRWRDTAALLPEWWSPRVVTEPARDIEAFFAAVDP